MAGHAPPTANWHAADVPEVLDRLGTTLDGLTQDEAGARLQSYGPNRLKSVPPVSPFKLVLDEFRSPLILILIASAALLIGVALIGDDREQIVDAILILMIVALNGTMGFVQNFRAQRGIESLQSMAAPTSTFIRDGHIISAQSEQLVPGDIVLIEEGDRIPADGRIASAYDLRVDEAALTGESVPRSKHSEPLEADTSLADRTNLLFSGTVAIRGRGRFVVTETGMNTQMGRIAEDIQSIEDGESRFQREVSSLGK